MFSSMAGCAAMNLLEGKLPIGNDDDLGLVTSPYPGWDDQAKKALDRIPSKDGKAKTPQPTAKVDSPTGIPVAETEIAVTQEQPAVTNPAATPASVTTEATAKGAIPPVQSAPIVKAPPAISPAVSPPPAVAVPTLAHPTHNHPVAVAGAEQSPSNVPAAAVATAAGPATAGDNKKEPTAAERLSALIKQRSEFLEALTAEVNRRRNSADDAEELIRLEKELRLVQLAGEQPEEAVRQIEKLDATEKDAFAHLLMGLATWMSADEARRPTLRNAKIVREIRDAAAELAAASKLDVRNLAFCEKVESYGWYTEFTKSQFKPKQEVLLYAEVENFTAVKISEESYETELQGSYQIFDSHGKLVDERELPLDLEQCRNYRRDYFLAYRIYLPDGLSSGSYRLELTVEDKKGSAIHPEPKPRSPLAETQQRGEKEGKLGKLAVPSSASSYKGRKLGTGTIEFTIK
jgi:hypothetical protein